MTSQRLEHFRQGKRQKSLIFLTVGYLSLKEKKASLFFFLIIFHRCPRTSHFCKAPWKCMGRCEIWCAFPEKLLECPFLAIQSAHLSTQGASASLQMLPSWKGGTEREIAFRELWHAVWGKEWSHRDLLGSGCTCTALRAAHLEQTPYPGRG